MSIFKRCLALSLVIIITLGMSGCMSNQIVIPGSNEAIMLKQLKEKYNGQEFITIGMSGGGYFGGGDSYLYCYPKGGDPVADRVWIRKSKGSMTFDDTYFGIIIREDVEAEVLAACSDLPLPMKVYFKSDVRSFSNYFDGTKTYADFKQWEIDKGERLYFNITVAVPMDGTDNPKKQEYANKVFDKLLKGDYYGSVDVPFYPHKEFDKVTRSLKVINELAEQSGDEYTLITGRIKDGTVKTNN